MTTQPRPLLQRIIVGIVAIIALAYFMNWGISQVNCDREDALLVPSSNWKITSSTTPAQILWQRAEWSPRPNVHLGFPNTGIVANQDGVLYGEFSGTSSCDTNATENLYDAATGQERWRYRPFEYPSGIFTVTDGYIFLGVSGMTKLDFQGHILWTQGENIGFRSIHPIYEIDSKLYLPDYYGKVYIVSNKTGELIQTETDMGSPVYLSEQFGLFATAENSLQLLDIKNHWLLYALTFPDGTFQNTPLNPLWPFVVRYKDILFLYFNSTSVEAHDFFTGQLLWEFDKPMAGTPALLNDVMVIYALPNELEILDPQTGRVLGNVELSRVDTSSANALAVNSDPRFSVWITAYQDTVYIRQIDSLELIAVKMDLSGLSLNQ